MKAITYDRYGGTERLRVDDVPEPRIGEDEVLVRVYAASVNSWDWEKLRGTPFMNRLDGPLRPRYPVLGADVAGTVEAVGRDVRRLRAGDEVFGDVSTCGWGGFAEYVRASEDALAPKPRALTFEQAAAVPQAGVLAWQSLHRDRPIRTGSRVLINGAGGGAGTFAVQIAKALGAEVTGVDRGPKLETVREIGADHTMDCTVDDFTATGHTYDHIVDMTARHSIFACRRALRPNGTYVVVGASLPRTAQALVVGPTLSRRGTKASGFFLHEPGRAALVELTDVLETGVVVPVVDSTYPLAEVPAAIDHFASGSVVGKLVIRVWAERAGTVR